MLPKMNIYFKDDFFFLVCWSDISKQASRTALKPLVRYLNFVPFLEQLTRPFTVVLRLRCPFIRLTNLSKASRTLSVMSETLTRETVHVRIQLSPVNHCQNDKKTLLGKKGCREIWALPLRFCWLANPVTLVQFRAILSLLLECLSLPGCILWCILRIPNSSECFGSHNESWSTLVFDVESKHKPISWRRTVKTKFMIVKIRKQKQKPNSSKQSWENVQA